MGDGDAPSRFSTAELMLISANALMELFPGGRRFALSSLISFNAAVFVNECWMEGLLSPRIGRRVGSRD